KNEKIVAGGNGIEYRINQVKYPIDIVIDKENDYFIVSDRANRRIVRWSRSNNTNGQIIISDIHCYGLTIDNNEYLYVSNTGKHEVERWKIGNKDGTIVAGGNREDDHLNQPTFIFVGKDYSLYIADGENHHVMKWIKGGKERIIVVGRNGQGKQSNQFNDLNGLSFDQQGDLYIVDRGNNRIQKFEIVLD
ncbi:unnamed protein product, partial [Rotaria sordida]